MNENTACSALRLISVVTVLTGLCFATVALAAAFVMDDPMATIARESGVAGITGFRQLGFTIVLSDLAVAGWGVLLYRLSPRLARHITSA